PSTPDLPSFPTRRSSDLDFNSLDRCLSRGLPTSMVPFPYNNGLRIFQAPGYVVIQLELIHETRVIPLDRAAHLPGTMTKWLGDSDRKSTRLNSSHVKSSY